MSLALRGMGWVTPLGNSIDTVWEKLLRGKEACAEMISDPAQPRSYSVFRAPENKVAHPRLRRASAISRFAAAAGLSALADAGISPDTDLRIALIFATSNGGVIYTKRFYHDIVATGAQSASPLLFPETVFNAPASHLAAILGITGVSYTVVGDGAVAILALKLAEDLMQNDAIDYCLVVAAEEVDWLLCDAYRRWRLLRMAPPIEPFGDPPKGMILSEGAGALLLSRHGPIQIEKVSAGGNFARRAGARNLLCNILAELKTKDGAVIVGSANGTFVDHAERNAIVQTMPDAQTYSVKPALGESIGVSAVWQTIAAAQIIRSQKIPPSLHQAERFGAREGALQAEVNSAIILSCGLSQQAGGLRISFTEG